MTNKKLSKDQMEDILQRLKSRFEENMNRHKGLEWDSVKSKLDAAPEKLWSLFEMEKSGANRM